MSTLKRVRGKFNVAVHSAKTAASHFLSPLFAAKDNYEPFIYIFKTRLPALRATLFTFQTDVHEFWDSLVHVDLVANQTKNGSTYVFCMGLPSVGLAAGTQLDGDSQGFKEFTPFDVSF